MSARKNIKNCIFDNVLVLEYSETRDTHAIWKCKCLKCGDIFYPTYSNLKSGNTRSCIKCSKRKFSRETRDKIRSLFKAGGITKVQLGKDFGVHRSTIANIILEKD